MDVSFPAFRGTTPVEPSCGTELCGTRAERYYLYVAVAPDRYIPVRMYLVAVHVDLYVPVSVYLY